MKYWYWFIQTFFFQPVTGLAIRLFYRVEVSGKENLSKLKTPVIAVANHKGIVDSFLMGFVFPWSSKFYPMRYMAEEIKFNGPFLDFFRKIKLLKLLYRIGGAFPSGRGLGLEGAIQHPLKLLAKGETIVMFPEGRIIKEPSLGIFYPGAAALALRSSANLLPIAIRPVGRKIFIKIGEPFRLGSNPHPLTIDEATQIIKEKIQNLLG